MPADTLKSYRIKYDVHCKLQNFFGKEIIIKNCYSEVQAKYKLGAYCEKKYGAEFDFITFKSVTENNFGSLFGELYGDGLFGCDKKLDIDDYTSMFDDMIKKIKNKK